MVKIWLGDSLNFIPISGNADSTIAATPLNLAVPLHKQFRRERSVGGASIFITSSRSAGLEDSAGID
jgi:hypothetical protein